MNFDTAPALPGVPIPEKIIVITERGWSHRPDLVRRGDTTTQIHGRLRDRDKPLGQYFARAEWETEDDGSDYLQQTPCTWSEAPSSKSDADRCAAEILNALA